MKLHYTQEMKYLRAVADYLRACGYDVEEPSTKHRDLLGVWGIVDGRRCYVEIYVTMYACNGGVNGIWHQGEHDGVEVFLDPDFGLEFTNSLELILDGLTPRKSRSKK